MYRVLMGHICVFQLVLNKFDKDFLIYEMYIENFNSRR